MTIITYEGRVLGTLLNFEEMADEADALAMAPGDVRERTEKAVEAMGFLGLERDLVIKTLKRLHKAFEYSQSMWDHVEMENYRMLADEALNLQTKLEKKRERATADDDASERPSRNVNRAQSSFPSTPRVNSYPERSAAALKALASNIIQKEEEAGRKKMQSDRKVSAQKDPSLSLSGRGPTPRTDGRAVRIIDPSEVTAARRRPDNNIAHKKFKQRKEEFKPQISPPALRAQVSGSHDIRKKRQRLVALRELNEPGGEAGEVAHGSDHDIDRYVKGQCRHDDKDLSRGFEAIPIPIVNHINSETLPSSFFYIDKSRPYEKAFVNLAISRIGDDDCCPNCHNDCLSAPYLCACARETGGEFAYTSDGCLHRRYIDQFLRIKKGLSAERKHYCESGFHCPHERHKNEENPTSCKGHPVRDFLKECSSKCGCSKQCGNRVVQRGISRKLEVYMTPEGKGWGIRTLEDLPAGAFVFEYVGEILTNTEMWERNNEIIRNGEGRHTYPVALDGDWGSEANLKDEEALCLDATYFGNVARFLNHRCLDANLMEMPVEIESPDRHYYHVCFSSLHFSDVF